MNFLAPFLVILIAFVFEGLATHTRGLYVIPTLAMLVLFFSSPIVIRSLNACIAGCVGFLVLSIWRGNMFFTAPYFIMTSLIIYGIAKK